MPLGRALARPATFEVIPPARAWSQFLERWADFRSHLEKGELALARESFQLALEAKWDGAVGDMPVESIALIRWAGQFHHKGDPEAAAWLAVSSERLSPGSVWVHLALARYYLGGGPVKVGDSVSQYFKALGVLKNDFPALFRCCARVLIFPVVFLGLFGIMFGVIVALRYSPLLVHDFSDLFPQKLFPRWMLRALVLVILLLPLAAGLSFWWLFAWWFLFLSMYMKRSERVLACLWLVALLAIPRLLNQYSVFAGTRSDEVLQAALRVRRGMVQSGDREVLESEVSKRPGELVAGFSLAQLLQRDGRFNKAALVYGPALKDPETAQEAFNNIAEIYLWAGDLDSTYRALSEAMRAGRPRVETVFNLGQYFQEAEELTRMDKEYTNARALDEVRLEQLLERSTVRRINRFMAPLPVPWSLVWQRSRRGSLLSSAAAPGIWNRWMGQPMGLPFLAGVAGVLVVMLLLSILGKKWMLSNRCFSCGRPICLQCQRPSKEPGMCSPCYNVFRGEGGVDLKIKMEKRSQVQRYRDLWSRCGLAASFLLPGSGQMLLGFTGAGLVLYIFAGAIISGFLTRRLIWEQALPAYQGGVSLIAAALGLIYLVLMIISLVLLRQRAETWR